MIMLMAIITIAAAVPLGDQPLLGPPEILYEYNCEYYFNYRYNYGLIAACI